MSSFITKANSGFEIPTYLLAKCKPKLENAS